LKLRVFRLKKPLAEYARQARAALIALLSLLSAGPSAAEKSDGFVGIWRVSKQ
jgi:hypothetical protein